MSLVLIAIFWMLAIWGAFSRRPVLLYLFFASMAFGSFAVVPPTLTAGLSLTAAPIVLLLISVRALGARDGPDFFLTSALRFDRMGLLFLFWIVAIVCTIFLPRVFEGEVLVVAVRDVREGASLLEPTAQNFSQLVYLSISILGVFAFSKVLRTRRDRQYALKAMLFGGVITVLTGFADFLTQYLPIEPLLDGFRNATYAMVTDAQVLGGKRVVGLMPEASAYGGVALGFLASAVFFRRAIADRKLRNVYAPILIGLLALFVYLSTSSGALLGLFVLALVVLGEGLLRAFSRGKAGRMHRKDLVAEFTIALVMLTAVGITFLVYPVAMEPMFDLIDRMVLSKSNSASFEERGMWRAVSLESLWATNGLGVGLGGTRASSTVVSIFSATGILGGVLFYAFVIQSLMRRSAQLPWESQLMLTGFRFSFIPPFVLGLLVGGADFGGMTAFGLGLVTAVATSREAMAARRQAKVYRLKRSRQHDGHLLGQAGAPPRLLGKS